MSRVNWWDNVYAKKARIKEIHKLISDSNGMTFIQIFGWVMWNIGHTKARTQQYLNDMMLVGLIYKKGDKYYARK